MCLRTMHTNRVCSDQLYRLSYISLLYRTYRLPNCHSTHSIMLIMIVILARALKKCADAIVHVTVVLCKWLMAHSTAEPAGHGKIPQNMYTRLLYYLTIIGSVCVRVMRLANALALKSPLYILCFNFFSVAFNTFMDKTCVHLPMTLVNFAIPHVLVCLFVHKLTERIVPFCLCVFRHNSF